MVCYTAVFSVVKRGGGGGKYAQWLPAVDWATSLVHDGLDCKLEQVAEEVREYFSDETMSKPSKYSIYIPSDLGNARSSKLHSATNTPKT